MIPCRYILGQGLRRQARHYVGRSGIVFRAAASQTATTKKSTHVNQKLKDITDQIQQTLVSNDTKEIKNIIEEGITFLNQVQKQEFISEQSLANAFTPLATELFEMVKSKNEADLESLVEFFIEHRIAHPYHFTELAASWLRHEPSIPSSNLDKVIQLWVKYIEYKSANQVYFPAAESLTKKPINYQPFYFTNLAYYAYVLSCLQQGVAFDRDTATKFLMRDRVPTYQQVRVTLEQNNIFSRTEFGRFVNYLEEDRKQKIDPNSSSMITRIHNASDKRSLDNLYAEIVEISKQRDLKIEERILVQFMESYFYLDEYDEVFSMFQNIINSGIAPSIGAWNVVLRGMINPNRFSRASTEQRKEFIKAFERTLATIKASKLDFNAETLGAIISSYAIADKFDVAEEYAKKYDKLGITSTAKDGILRGLIFNGRIKDAESKLKEYVNEKDGYRPKTNLMNDFLNYYAKRKNYNAIFAINDFMQQNKIPENVSTLTTITNAYVSALVEKGRSPNLAVFLNSLKGSATKLNDYTFSSVLNGLIQSANIQAARELYRVLHLRYPRSAWIHSNMLTAELTLGDITTAEAIFLHYLKEIRNDTIIWNTMIKNLLPRNDKLALEYYEKLKLQTSASPNRYTYYFLFDHFGKRANKDVIRMLLGDLAKTPLNEYGEQLSKLLSQINATLV
ncbi:hypothetical protein KGF56_002312 [Candida oxycetoniae]|uniref:Mitochondrial group I intron splicing factor CCM1 n=1 Tax=Candida oxycetoniae TaxID=497107 RepID=A0AAI9WY14_9ASCO|nr:uncharacterized protein KGF56_002312 [Candida oxycetoniae]KAI3404896.2 hypothetical protein KGF56_002312 [Candida oxycetoniae]